MLQLCKNRFTYDNYTHIVELKIKIIKFELRYKLLTDLIQLIRDGNLYFQSC